MKNKIQHIFKFSHKFKNKDQIILRDYLALERTSLANERTMLSYIRSSLYFVVGGVALIKIEDLKSIRILGYLSLVLATTFIVIGIFRFFKMRRRLSKYYSQIEKIKKIKEEKSRRSDSED